MSKKHEEDSHNKLSQPSYQGQAGFEDHQRYTPDNTPESIKPGLLTFLRNVLKNKQDDASLRETIEEYIDVATESKTPDSEAQQEKTLLSNILKLRDASAYDIMVPRAEIVAIDVRTTQEELLELLSERQYSRIPVYKNTLDDVLGTIHIKDILATLAKGEPINIKEMMTDIPIVSPAMPIQNLLVKMRESSRHMVLVVDEYGGIDGMVTIGDIIKFIVGQINDEHDLDDGQSIIEKSDGSILADARVELVDFEKRFGRVFSEKDHEESDTLAGLAYLLAGRVPARGDILKHPSGMVFEILDADARRVNKLKIKNFPRPS